MLLFGEGLDWFQRVGYNSQNNCAKASNNLRQHFHIGSIQFELCIMAVFLVREEGIYISQDNKLSKVTFPFPGES